MLFDVHVAVCGIIAYNRIDCAQKGVGVDSHAVQGSELKSADGAILRIRV